MMVELGKGLAKLHQNTLMVQCSAQSILFIEVMWADLNLGANKKCLVGLCPQMCTMKAKY